MKRNASSVLLKETPSSPLPRWRPNIIRQTLEQLVVKKPRRTKQLNVRLSTKELTQFHRVADHFGISISSVLRMLVVLKAHELDVAQSAQAELLANRFR